MATKKRTSIKWLTCFNCGKVVANLRIEENTIVRAVVLCPECYAEEHGIDMGKPDAK